MTPEQRNDLFYVCCRIEHIGCITKNRRQDVVNAIGKEEIERQLNLADVNHCISIEQVTDELIEYCQIQMGQFDTIAQCNYTIPKDYCNLIVDVLQDREIADVLIDVFSHLSVMKSPILIPLYTIQIPAI